jgi:hypothetical protein
MTRYLAILGATMPDYHLVLCFCLSPSTRIEGAELTDNDIEKLLAGLDIKEFASRDKQEAGEYAQTIETICAHWQDIPLKENHIKQLHLDSLKLHHGFPVSTN